jgi:hypothetical protein
MGSINQYGGTGKPPPDNHLATMSFWQGIDVPGPSLSLVSIDRRPFPRLDDPLLQAPPRTAPALVPSRPCSRLDLAPGVDRSPDPMLSDVGIDD